MTLGLGIAALCVGALTALGAATMTWFLKRVMEALKELREELARQREERRAK